MPETTTPAVAEPTVTPPVKKAMNPMMSVGVVVLAVVVLLVGASIAVAANLGKNNALSQAAAVLPVEQIPLLQEFAKKPDVLVRDALISAADIKQYEAAGGKEIASTITFDLDAEVPGARAPMPVSSHMEMNTTMATNGDMTQAKQSLSMTGNFRSGVVSVDMGKEGMNMEMLMPSESLIYFKASLSPEIRDTIKSVEAMAAQEMGAVEPTSTKMTGSAKKMAAAPETFPIEKYLDRYLKFDLDAYFKMMQEIAKENGMDTQIPDSKRVLEAQKKLVEKLTPDFTALGVKSGVLDLSSYSTITSQTRGQVGSQPAIIVNLDVHMDKLAGKTQAFFDGFWDVVKAHRADFIAYCEDSGMMMGSTETTCSETFSEETFTKMEEGMKQSPEEMAMMKEMLNSIMRSVMVKDVQLAISPVDNSILMSKYTLEITDASLQPVWDFAKKQGGSKEDIGFTLKSMKVAVFSEEKNRGMDLKVVEPAESVDVVPLIRDYIDGMRASAMNSTYANPTLGAGSASKMPAGYEDMTDLNNDAYSSSDVDVNNSIIINNY